MVIMSFTNKSELFNSETREVLVNEKNTGAFMKKKCYFLSSRFTKLITYPESLSSCACEASETKCY